MIGIGTDLTSVERMERSLERFGRRFAERVLSGRELALAPSGKNFALFLAGRWAAKEAFVKALGTGFANGIGPKDIEILRNSLGAPKIELSPQARAVFGHIGATRAHVSISHDAGLALAFVIIE